MGDSRDLDVMLGNPRKAVLAMAAPLVISYLIIELNTFMDLSWCSGLGAACSSAVSSISPLMWIASGLGTGLGVGASAAIAAKLGTGQRDESNSIATQTLVMTVAMGLLITVVLYLCIDPVIDMMGVTDIRSECHVYIEPMLVGSVFIVLNGVVAGLLRAEGSAKRSTYVLVTAAVTHMCLDPVFIYGFGFGLAGAAYATVIGMGLGAALGLHWYVSGKTVVRIELKGYRPNKKEIMLVLAVGIPRSLEIFIISFMSMIQRIFVVQCGGTQAAMFYNIPWNYVTLAQSISMSLGSALIPISAAATARGQARKARYAFRYAMVLSLTSMSVIGVALFLLSDWAVVPFTYSDTMAPLRPEFAHVLRIYTLVIPCMAVVDVASSMLQSLRKAQLSMVSCFIRNGLVVAVLAWAATVSLDAIYWGLVVCEVFGAFLMMAIAQWMVAKVAPQKVRLRDVPD